MATAYFAGLEGDVRVQDKTIIVTYYNSTYNSTDVDKLRAHYEDLPAKLRAEKVDPRVPGSTTSSWTFVSANVK